MDFLTLKCSVTYKSRSSDSPFPHLLTTPPKSRLRLGYQIDKGPAISRDQFLSELNEAEDSDENRRVKKTGA